MAPSRSSPMSASDGLTMPRPPPDRERADGGAPSGGGGSSLPLARCPCFSCWRPRRRRALSFSTRQLSGSFRRSASPLPGTDVIARLRNAVESRWLASTFARSSSALRRPCAEQGRRRAGWSRPRRCRANPLIPLSPALLRSGDDGCGDAVTNLHRPCATLLIWCAPRRA
jgi:hypothetical protein